MNELASLIRDIPDFPKKGIIFKDITPLWADRRGLKEAIEKLADFIKEEVDTVVSPEARGFIIGAALAYKIGAGFVPVRKPGKLPYKVLSEKYTLEYGEDEIQIHADAIKEGQRVLIVDDLLATGGTVAAIVRLLERMGAKIVGICFLVELTFLGGRKKFPKYNVFSLIKY